MKANDATALRLSLLPMPVSEMLARVRSLRGGTCTVILALVALSLLHPIFYGTKLSENKLRLWLTGSKSADESSNNLAPDYAFQQPWPRLDAKYGTASCALKVYVYEFPRRFNFGLLQKDNAPHQDLPWQSEPLPVWPQRSGLKKQHNVEYWMMVDLLDRRIDGDSGRAAVRVDYPEQADLFFVPFFSSLSFNKYGNYMRDPLAERDKMLQEEVVRLLFNSKWWRRSGGRDHVVIIHHPNAFRYYKHLLNPAIFVVADFGRSSPNVSSLKKDVVAPYTHVVPTFEDDDVKDPFETRTTLLYFQGRIKRKDDGIVRTQLAYLLQNKTGIHFEDGIATAEGVDMAKIGMRSSRFCLHPAGDTPSSCRLFDAIVSHCVPVIVSDKIELPFENELNYSSFALFFSTEEALQPGWLLTKLQRFEKKQWLEMFLNLKEIARHFEFQHPTMEDDAVNMIWKQLHRKVPAIKLAMHRNQRLKIADWWR